MLHMQGCDDTRHEMGPCRDDRGTIIDRSPEAIAHSFRAVAAATNSHLSLKPFVLVLRERTVRPSPVETISVCSPWESKGMVEVAAMPMVDFRPVQLGITSRPGARFLVTLYIRSQFFDLGSTDLWPRAPGQLASAFLFDVSKIDTIKVSESVKVVVTNLSKKFARTFVAQIAGVIEVRS